MKQEGKKKSEQVKTGMCVSVWVTECVCVCVCACVWSEREEMRQLVVATYWCQQVINTLLTLQPKYKSIGAKNGE